MIWYQAGEFNCGLVYLLRIDMKKNKQEVELIVKRKKDHLKVALSEISQVGNPGFDKYRFVHNALPEFDFNTIETSTTFLGKKVNYPFFISCMTGGIEDGERLNSNLAKAAQKYNIAMGVGSQRIAIEHPELRRLFKVRDYAKDVPVIANVGLVQLNYGFGLKEMQKCIDMVEANALALHVNPIQEVIQPEGDRNFEKLLPKLERLVKKLSVPIIVKEVGFGLSENVIRSLYNVGVRIFDTAGWGGTSWAMIEGLRGKADKSLGELFSGWGIPTADSIIAAAKVKEEKKDGSFVILGSGGVRTGIDMAKSIALGAHLVGVAQPFAGAAYVSHQEVGELIEKYSDELKTAMFGVGARNILDLKKINLTSV